jgi:hypothetical protein
MTLGQVKKQLNPLEEVSPLENKLNTPREVTLRQVKNQLNPLENILNPPNEMTLLEVKEMTLRNPPKEMI